MPVKFYTEQEYMEMVRERNGLQRKVEVLEQLRPVWEQGHTGKQVVVGEIRMQPDYWSRGHFHTGRAKELVAIGNIQQFPVGTKICALLDK